MRRCRSFPAAHSKTWPVAARRRIRPRASTSAGPARCRIRAVCPPQRFSACSPGTKRASFREAADAETETSLSLIKLSRASAEEIYSRNRLGTWVGRPSLKSYEDSIFAPSTFFAAILTFGASARAFPSLINTGFAGIHAADSRSKQAGGKSGLGTIRREIQQPLWAR